jgi:uncharacterized Zn finger protein
MSTSQSPQQAPKRALESPELSFEYCPSCADETVHELSLALHQETKSGSEPAGRQPYRTVECQECGRSETSRQ